jgi:hypothetical protein
LGFRQATQASTAPRRSTGKRPRQRFASFLKTRPAEEEPCDIALRRRSSRHKVVELGARTRDLAGARTRPWATTHAVLLPPSRVAHTSDSGGPLEKTLASLDLWPPWPLPPPATAVVAAPGRRRRRARRRPPASSSTREEEELRRAAW